MDAKLFGKDIDELRNIFTCPFCFQKIGKAQIPYVCDCGERIKPNILASRFISKPKRCPQCGKIAINRKCPACDEYIPKTALETPNLPFSIVGVSNAGKTNYITVMLEELGKMPGLHLAVGHQNEYTRKHQEDNRKLIYEKQEKPPNTAGDITPQIWWVKNNNKKSRNKTPTYTFTIFDGAGEDHEERLDPTLPVCQYIKVSKAILLVVDPLILQSIRKKRMVNAQILANSIGNSSQAIKDYNNKNINAKDVLNGVANYLKTALGVSEKSRIKIPVAVVITKFDTIINHPSFSKNALIKKPSLTVKNGTINLAEIEQIHQELENWFIQIGEMEFLENLRGQFEEFHLFGVSSYGSPPVSLNTLPNEIKPHRVLDPILWLFKNAGFID